MIKLYFRELQEPLLSSKLSEILVAIHESKSGGHVSSYYPFSNLLPAVIIILLWNHMTFGEGNFL